MRRICFYKSFSSANIPLMSKGVFGFVAKNSKVSLFLCLLCHTYMLHTKMTVDLPIKHVTLKPSADFMHSTCGVGCVFEVFELYVNSSFITLMECFDLQRQKT